VLLIWRAQCGESALAGARLSAAAGVGAALGDGRYAAAGIRALLTESPDPRDTGRRDRRCAGLVDYELAMAILPLAKQTAGRWWGSMFRFSASRSE